MNYTKNKFYKSKKSWNSEKNLVNNINKPQ